MEFSRSSRPWRLGAVVEICGSLLQGQEGLEGQLGKLVEWNEDSKWSVAFLNGDRALLDQANFREPTDFKKTPGRGGGPDSFDLFVDPLTEQYSTALGGAISCRLFEKGFCVLKLSQSVESHQQALEHVLRLDQNTGLQRLPEEVEEGYLGAGMKGKISWLKDDGRTEHENAVINQGNDFLSCLAQVLQEPSGDACGTRIAERSRGLVSLSLSPGEEPEYPNGLADDKLLGEFLDTWRRSVVRAVYFMGPGTASLALVSNGTDAATALPALEEKTVSITATQGTLVLFRTPCFEYSCVANEEILLLTSDFLESKQQLEWLDVGELDGGLASLETGPPPPPVDANNGNIYVLNLATGLAAEWDTAGAYCAGLFCGTDSFIEHPFYRYDYRPYYHDDESTALPHHVTIRHRSHVDGLDWFDNKMFEIPAKDVPQLDPMQRHVLETGAKLLWQQGIDKKIANRTPFHAGVSVGLDKNLWNDRQDQILMEEENKGGVNVQAIISNRFSFIFNLKGPNYVADTACSASLCATHMAKYMLQDRKYDPLDFHLAFGIHHLMSLCIYMGTHLGHMYSERCKTFDQKANGYSPGEGCSGLTLKWGDLKEESMAMWRASQCGQNGRSATMTAPNGLAQEDVMWKTIREAGIEPTESCGWSCHGTGTSLGDPIEVGAVRRIQIKVARPTALAVNTNKTSTGHLEGGAAMTSLVAAVLQVSASKANPIIHFHTLNPHLEASQFDAFFNNEAISYGYCQGNFHVSSFGFGGTNGHVIFWGKQSVGAVSTAVLWRRRLQNIPPPEVRVNGTNPADWESDLPDKDIKPGDRYMIPIRPDDSAETKLKYVKEESGGPEYDDGLLNVFYIVGDFNEWRPEIMPECDIPGQSTIVVEVPNNGVLEFRLVMNNDFEQLIGPAVSKSTRMCGAIVGPVRDLQNVWVARGDPGSMMQISFFCCRGMRSIMWGQV